MEEKQTKEITQSESTETIPEISAGTRKLKIKYNKKGCIGVGVCSNVAPAHFVLDDANIADLMENDSKVPNTEGDFAVKEVEANEGMQKELMQAANGCPVDVIEIYDAESGEKLWPVRD